MSGGGAVSVRHGCGELEMLSTMHNRENIRWAVKEWGHIVAMMISLAKACLACIEYRLTFYQK